MTKDSSNSNTEHECVHLSSVESAPELAHSKTTIEHPVFANSDAENAMIYEMKFAFAEHENFELECKIHSLERKITALEAHAHELEGQNSVKVAVMRDLLEKLKVSRKNNQEKDLELNKYKTSDKCEQDGGTAQEEARLRKQVQALENRNEDLSNKLVALGLENKNLKASVENAHIDRSRITELEAANNALATKNDQLVDKNDELTAKHFAAFETAKKFADDASFARARDENTRLDLKEALANLSTVLADRDRLQDDMFRRYRQGDPASENLRSDNRTLKEENERLSELVTNFQWNVVLTVNCLDGASTGFRIYTCDHDGLRAIPDDNRSTRLYTAENIAAEIFKCYHDDEDFIRLYTQERQDLINHHSAHERSGPGRGVAPWRLRKELQKIDDTRGVNVVYQ